MTNDVLMHLGKPGKRCAVHKQFYRFIRPGAVQVLATVTGRSLIDMAGRGSGVFLAAPSIR